MKTGNRSSAMLTELLIVVMFFLLTSTVLLQVFTAARAQSEQAETFAAAVAETQNVADRLYAAGGADGLLEQMGFQNAEGDWVRDDGAFLLRVYSERTEDTAGVMVRQSVTALTPEGEELLSLPCSRWLNGEETA